MFKVKVLSLTGPMKINVRPLDWEGDYSDLKQNLDLYFSDPANANHIFVSMCDGDSVCVQWRGQWFRAVILGQDFQESKVLVRLVDNGQLNTVPRENIRHCPSEFLQKPSRSFCCHLDGVMFGDDLIKDDKLLDVVSALPESKVVQLIKKGPPVVKQFENSGISFQLPSLPVELTWDQALADQPFLPDNARVFSLTEMFHKCLGVDTSVNNLDDTLELVSDDGEKMKEFEDVKPMTENKTFQWLPPQLPQKRKFSARGIFVDHSGQIYIQLHSQRHTVAALQSLLNEKFSGSVPDETSFAEGQECCVRWRNGSWFRGRFLRYLDIDMTDALVYLVDFGDVHKANVKEEVRRTIYADKVPIQALRVELAGVTPLGPDNTWSPECLDAIQELINCERSSKSKLKVEIVDDSDILPLQVRIKVTLANGTRHYLDSLLGQEVQQKPNDSPSHRFLEMRQLSDIGIQAVPFGTYQDQNFYSLVYGKDFMSKYCFMSEESCPKVHYIDWSQTGLSYGDILIGEFVEMGKEPNVVYLHPTDQNNKYMKSVLDEYDRLYPEAQVACADAPPVFQPVLGMMVSVLYQMMGWYRAEIIRYTDTTITVRYIDFGNIEEVRDSLWVREIPGKFAMLPAIAVKLELDTQCVESEDIGHCVMLECLASYEDEDIGIKISGFKDDGALTGHLVDLSTGAYLYQCLFKEGIFVET